MGEERRGEETHLERRPRILRDLARERPALCNHRAHIHRLRRRGFRPRQSQCNPHRLWGQPCRFHVGYAREPTTRLRARPLQPLGQLRYVSRPCQPSDAVLRILGCGCSTGGGGKLRDGGDKLRERRDAWRRLRVIWTLGQWSWGARLVWAWEGRVRVLALWLLRIGQLRLSNLLLLLVGLVLRY